MHWRFFKDYASGSTAIGKQNHDDNDRCRENTMCVLCSINTAKLKCYLNWQ